jgi:hypothetical protein
MWTLAASIFFGLKWQSFWKARTRVAHPAWRSVAYLFAWPGMDAESFLDPRAKAQSPKPSEWILAAAETALGVVLFWFVARKIPAEEPLLRGWIGMLGIIFVLHFGVFQILALFWQSLGVDAPRIMASPHRAASLSEFWGKRWNLGFRELAHDLVFAPLHKSLGVPLAGFFVFVLSGLIHDLVISVPARGGYGLPTAYFVMQGLGVMLERSRFGRRLGLGKGALGAVYMLIFTAGPVFWLFHPPFVLRVIIPFMKAARAL